ncbi:MAG: hypothetical protein WCK77_09705, partial [Verrucomicrobiota bacterium]
TELLDGWCDVARVVNPQAGKHLVVASLFWKNARKEEGELPPITRQLMMDAAKLGLVSRFAPWNHYVLPLLDGARTLKEARPDLAFRVYLAADLEFLVEDLVAAGCEVMVMKSSSLRHNPGALWRFLAFEEEGRWITITDSDHAPEVLHNVERTEHALGAGHGLWRVPYILDGGRPDNDPGFYRPINACQFGAVGGYPVALLMKALLWHTLRGSMPGQCVIGSGEEPSSSVPVFGTDWPSYGFDEWFLLAVLYPRMACNSVLTFVGWNDRTVNHWFALDVEYATWANPKSEMLYFGAPALDAKLALVKVTVPARSPILDYMLSAKLQEQAAKVPLPVPPPAAPLTLVVARYNEDLRWLLQVPEEVTVVLYNKGPEILDPLLRQRVDHLVALPNLGREADTYLHHLQEYPQPAPEGWTVFCQGDPFPHSPDFLALLQHPDRWAEVQPLTAGYVTTSDIPPANLRVLDDGEWLGRHAIRTELSSTATLDMHGWQDEGGRKIMRDYCQHHCLPRGWSITGHFLETCGLTDLAEQAWDAALVQFAYGAMFGVRNARLGMIPQECIPAMRRLAQGHYAHGYVFEKMWLHLFGLPFIRAVRGDLPRGRHTLLS